MSHCCGYYYETLSPPPPSISDTTCLELLDQQGRCSPPTAPVNSVLTIPPNQTLLHETVHLSINITDYNSSYAPYTHVLCMSKFLFFPYIRIYYLSCVDSESSAVNQSIKWQTAGDVTVYLFSGRNGSSEFGCNIHDIDIKSELK